MKMKTQLTLAAVVAAGLMASGCSQQMVGQQAVDTAVAAPAATKTIVKTIVDCSKCKKPAAPRGGNMHSHPAIPGCTDSIKHNHPHPQGGRHSHKYSCKKAAPKRMAPRKAAPAPRKAPAPRVAPRPAGHVHPAIPGCTDSIRHNHPSARGGAHTHRYSCRRAAAPARRAAPVRRAPAPQPRRRVSGHTHPAVPGCTNSVTHNHPTARGGAHTHRYVCRGAAAPAPRRPVVQQARPVQPVVNYQQIAQPKMIKPKGTYKGSIQIDGVMKQYQQ